MNMHQSIEDTDVVILCGGLGKRLRSLVPGSNKTMALIHDRPFLDLILLHLKKQGSRRIILCTGYKADQIEKYYRENDLGLTIDFSREEDPLGTGGAIKHARGFVRSDPFFALNGDSFCPVDYPALLKFFFEKESRAVVCVVEVEHKDDYGGVTLDEDQRILGFEEKKANTKGKYVNGGVYCLGQAVFDLMPSDERFSIEYDFFPQMIQCGFYGFIFDQPFWDIGTPERYQKALEDLM